jgi:hypothetical protein
MLNDKTSKIAAQGCIVAYGVCVKWHELKGFRIILPAL